MRKVGEAGQPRQPLLLTALYWAQALTKARPTTAAWRKTFCPIAEKLARMQDKDHDRHWQRLGQSGRLWAGTSFPTARPKRYAPLGHVCEAPSSAKGHFVPRASAARLFTTRAAGVSVSGRFRIRLKIVARARPAAPRQITVPPKAVS